MDDRMINAHQSTMMRPHTLWGHSHAGTKIGTFKTVGTSRSVCFLFFHSNYLWYLQGGPKKHEIAEPRRPGSGKARIGPEFG